MLAELCFSVYVWVWVCAHVKARASVMQKQVSDPLELVLFAVVNSPMWMLGAKFGSWAAPAQSQGEVSPTFAMLLFFSVAAAQYHL